MMGRMIMLCARARARVSGAGRDDEGRNDEMEDDAVRGEKDGRNGRERDGRKVNARVKRVKEIFFAGDGAGVTGAAAGTANDGGGDGGIGVSAPAPALERRWQGLSRQEATG
ncbi:hypothetical protein D9611_002100 [Ephemerocybe angulata]|uniref:Uncharacterized protein n=1 Tax=Ephemerocybe angulata TaxID=980116 RepID=A0A8H5FM18_9AGAR|nr:hypothetical protein D9611_002100 [Tulosesus angulatus]